MAGGANAFIVLSVNSYSSDAEVRRAYLEAALRLHPDKGGDAEQFRLARWAADTIGSAAGRAAHVIATLPASAGTWVYLVGLIKSPELNGAVGVAGAWDGRRLTVALSGGRQVAIPPANIEAAPPPATTSSWASATASAQQHQSSGGVASSWASATTSAQQRQSSGGVASSWASATSSTQQQQSSGGIASSWSSATAAAQQQSGASSSSFEELRRNPTWGVLWPYCILCQKWSDDVHRMSAQHVRRFSRCGGGGHQQSQAQPPLPQPPQPQEPQPQPPQPQPPQPQPQPQPQPPQFRPAPPPPQTVTMRAAFEGKYFGEEYLTLPVNACVELSGRPEENGWAHGTFDGASGWFPAAYALSSSMDITGNQVVPRPIGEADEEGFHEV